MKRRVENGFRKKRLLEKYGSAIQRIISAFKQVGLPSPQFKIIYNDFMATILAENIYIISPVSGKEECWC